MSIPLKSEKEEGFENSYVSLKTTIKPKSIPKYKNGKSNPDEYESECIGY